MPGVLQRDWRGVVEVVVVVSEVEVEVVMVLRQCCSAAGLSLTNNGEETCTAV